MRIFRYTLMVAIIAIAMLAGAAFAEQSGDWTYELTPSGLTITAYTGADAAVVIPDELDGYLVTNIGAHAFSENYTLQEITIPVGISSIQAEAFYGCSALAKINFNAKDCTVPEIWSHDNSKGVGVFSGAGSASPAGLTVVFGPEVTRVPAWLFATASMPEGNGHTGYPYCYVTEVIMSDSIKTIGNHAFRNCQKLRSVTFAGGVSTIEANAFESCTALETVALPDSLAFIGDYAFCNCTGLTGVDFGNGMDTIGAGAFMGCAALVEADIPAPTSTVSRSAFESCTGLTTVTLPKSLTTLGAQAFYGCVKLNTVNVNSVNLTVPEIWSHDSSKGVGVFSGAGSSSPAGLTVIFGEGVTRVPAWMFASASMPEGNGHTGYPYCYITKVVFPDSMETIGEYAFRNCQNLGEVDLGPGVTTIEACAFQSCISMESLTAGDGLAFIGDYAFIDCTGLETITWGAGLDSIGYRAFWNCSSLKELELPNPMTTLGTGAFGYCTSLKRVVLPESLTWLGGEVFRGCVKLSEVTINSVNLSASEVWSHADDRGVGIFSEAGASSAEGLSVVFSDGVTRVPDWIFDTASLDYNGHSGYPYAYITSVRVPATVTEIGSGAFRNCRNLEIVYIDSAEVTFGEEVFLGCTATGFAVECPAGSDTAAYLAENGLPVVMVGEPVFVPGIPVPSLFFR